MQYRSTGLNITNLHLLGLHKAQRKQNAGNQYDGDRGIFTGTDIQYMPQTF